MEKKYIIKLFKNRNRYFKINIFYICVSYKKMNTKVIEKLGSFFFWKGKKVYFLNVERLSFWLNRGCLLKLRVSWILYYLALRERNEKN